MRVAVQWLIRRFGARAKEPNNAQTTRLVPTVKLSEIQSHADALSVLIDKEREKKNKYVYCM